MPPKNTNLCGSRNKVLFNKYVGKTPLKINSLVARALAYDDELSLFKDQMHASECTFSYPGSDWFSVFLLDSEGKQYWNDKTGKVEKLYFKLILNPAGDDATIGERTTVMPRELEGLQNCIITPSGACGNPTGYKSRKGAADSQGESQGASQSAVVPSKTTKKKKETVTTDSGAGSSQVPVMLPSQESPESRQETLERVKTVQVGGIPGEQGTGNLPKAKIERSYFENLGSKELIIDWMIKNMKHADIIGCIKRGSLSPAIVNQAEALGGMASSSSTTQSVPGISDAEMQLVQQAMASMSTSDVKKTFKDISKTELIGFINSITDPIKKAQKIVQLCNYAGLKNFTVRTVQGRGGKQLVKIMDGDAELQPDEFNDVINECSEKEATRVSSILRKQAARKTVVQEASRRKQVIKGKGPAVSVPSSPRSPKGLSDINEIIGEIQNNPDRSAKIRDTVALCQQVGLQQFNMTSVQGRGGKTIVKLMEGDIEVQDDEINDVLTQCGTMKLSQLSRFGKKTRSKVVANFKKAAKKCKGGPNYKKCMKKTLRSYY